MTRASYPIHRTLVCRTLKRYESVEASRKIPNLNEIMKGKVEVKDSEEFKINVENRVAHVGGQEVFDRLIYTIE